MKKSSAILFSLVLCCCVSKLFAQADLGLHFQTDLLQASNSNPAFIQPWTKSLGLPLISNAGMAFNQNGPSFMKVFSFTGDSASFNPAKYIEGMSSRSYLSAESSLDIFSGSMKKHDIHWSAGISEKTFLRASYTKDLATLLWNGTAPFVKSMPDFTGFIRGTRYRELGVSAAKKFDNLQVGVRLKSLWGFQTVHSVSDTFMILNYDSLTYATSGQMNVNIRTSGLNNRLNGSLTENLMNFSNPGYALDLGISYMLRNGKASVSLSLVDVGAIWWRSDILNYSSTRDIAFEGGDLMAVDYSDSSGIAAIADSARNLFSLARTHGSFRTPLIPKTYLSLSAQASPRVYIGVLLYMEYIHGVHPSAAVQYRRAMSENLSLSLTYAVLNRNYNNLGAGLTWQWKRYQGFVFTDNIVSVFLPPVKLVMKENVSSVYVPSVGNSYGLRAGLNLVIGRIRTYHRPSVPL